MPPKHHPCWLAALALVSIAICSNASAGQQIMRPPLVLLAVNGNRTEVLVPKRDDGGFTAEDLQRAAFTFSMHSLKRGPALRKGAKVHPLAPRLLDLVYRAMRHFDAKVVRVVSGFRKDRAGSRHTQGRAVDMTIEGVPNEQLAAYVRDFGFVGVGLYPRSGFVHLDVRDASYFWVDDSAPGAACQLKPLGATDARLADAAARARGEKPDCFVPNNIDEDIAAAEVYAHRAHARQVAARQAAASKAAASKTTASKAAASKTAASKTTASKTAASKTAVQHAAKHTKDRSADR